jgi:hypothetical protein
MDQWGGVSREVNALTAAWEDFSVPLRMKDGVDDKSLANLRSALSDCADAWNGLDAIPRRAANVLVDISPTMETFVQSYGEPMAGKLREIAYSLQELVWACVAVDAE